MSLKVEPIEAIPDETVRVARAAFPKGSRAMQLRDRLGAVYADARFAALFAVRGRPAEAPWRLALVTVLQFAAGLSDRQAAEAVCGRIDWKYALGLALDDPGFHYSVLCEFRARLIGGGLENVLLEELLAACRTQGLLRRRGRQRTDSTHVLGALRLLNRLEQVAETVRAALDALAVADPEWLRARTPADWFERYGRRVEEYRLPQGHEAREAFARQVGEDGMRLLADAFAPEAPPALRALPAVEILRRTWVQRYLVWEGQVRLRGPKDQPPAAAQIVSPYDEAARYADKRSVDWVGYRVHLTETCDDDLPHLVTDVGTTVAPSPDVEQLGPIQARLAARDLPPSEHVVDTGYVRTSNLVTSQQVHQIDLIGPMYDDRQWQAKDPTAFDLTQFRIDWEAQVVTCPNGQRSTGWSSYRTARQAGRRAQIHVQFAPAACAACPVRSRCTRAKRGPRHLTLRPRAEYEALVATRQRQTTAAFQAQYAARAGIEGTLSQGVRAFGLRRCRYRGLAKTHLQEIATATALNLSRLADGWDGCRPVTVKRSAFAALACRT
jgi:transposase